jgi:pyrimidine-nucleoside phosphorylase
MLETINKKKHGIALDKIEINALIDGFIKEQIPDYQMAAFLMAVYFKGLNKEETLYLTDAMMRSGELIDLSSIKGTKVDKHSTGGVGDKTTLVLAPLVAAAGAPVAKMSGRGLGHTGGTIDKLESIKNFSIQLDKEQFIEKIQRHGIAVCGQSANLVPADKKIYALRDVTGTVDNVSLISSSIMSKKLACGADAIVLDVKVGKGSYMKTKAEGIELAKMLIDLGKGMDKKVEAVISAMEEPLGYAVGNALEVKEAIATLQGKGPADLEALCLELGSRMLVLSGVVKTKEAAVLKLKELIENGAAFEKFKEFIKAQNGDIDVLEDIDLLPKSSYSMVYESATSGYINQLDAKHIGVASMILGAGRSTKESEIDYGAGILLKKKIGDYVEKGSALAILYTNNPATFAKAKSILEKTYEILDEKPTEQPLIIEIIK